MNEIEHETAVVRELTADELALIDGAGWLSDAWDWTKEAASDAVDFVEDVAEAAWEYTKDNPLEVLGYIGALLGGGAATSAYDDNDPGVGYIPANGYLGSGQ